VSCACVNQWEDATCSNRGGWAGMRDKEEKRCRGGTTQGEVPLRASMSRGGVLIPVFSSEKRLVRLPSRRGPWDAPGGGRKTSLFPCSSQTPGRRDFRGKGPRGKRRGRFSLPAPPWADVSKRPRRSHFHPRQAGSTQSKTGREAEKRKVWSNTKAFPVTNRRAGEKI